MKLLARQCSLVLDHLAEKAAERTVAAHCERDPTLAERYGTSFHRYWADDVQERIHNLAQAVAVESPVLFRESVLWSETANVQREFQGDDLQISLDCLANVLSSHLPSREVVLALDYIRDAERCLNQDLPLKRSPSDWPINKRQLQLKFLEAALRGDRRVAECICIESVNGHQSVVSLYNELLEPAMIEIGEMWHDEEITVAQEHLATAVCESIMNLMRSRAKPPVSNGRRVLATSVEGDLHTLGIRMVADFFEMEGWEVIYLGASTPNQAVHQLLQSNQFDLLAVSITGILHLRTLGDLINAIRNDAGLKDQKILVGGQPLTCDDSIWHGLGADGFASTALKAVAVGNNLVEQIAKCNVEPQPSTTA